MNQFTKTKIYQKILDELQDTSQAKLAVKIGISKTAMSFLVNKKWNLINEKTWRYIKSNLNITDTDWILARTTGLVELTKLLKVVKSNSMSIAIVANAGLGKTEGFNYLRETKTGVFHVKCASHWTMRIFLQKTMQSIGLPTKGLSVAIMADGLIRHLKSLFKPLVIFDEADKLPNKVFLYMIDMYNQLDGNVSFVFAGTPYLQNMIEMKAHQDRRGFKEFYSRIGKTFINLRELSSDDVTLICIENGVDDPDEIDAIFTSCDGDIRRVKRSVQRYHSLKKSQAVLN